VHTHTHTHTSLNTHRFAGGVLGAKFSARNMLGWGLIATALINIAFGFSGGSMAALTTLWFVNGGLQVRVILCLVFVCVCVPSVYGVRAFLCLVCVCVCLQYMVKDFFWHELIYHS
jgi:uncharacterized membrane protein YwzB